MTIETNEKEFTLENELKSKLRTINIQPGKEQTKIANNEKVEVGYYSMFNGNCSYCMYFKNAYSVSRKLLLSLSKNLLYNYIYIYFFFI